VQVGSTIALDDVTVTDGLFTVQLDFGAVFDGTALYLEIGVRPAARRVHHLAPRQCSPPRPTPASPRSPWSGLVGVPPGFADGTDDGSTYTRDGAVPECDEFSILNSYQLPQTCANDRSPNGRST